MNHTLQNTANTMSISTVFELTDRLQTALWFVMRVQNGNLCTEAETKNEEAKYEKRNSNNILLERKTGRKNDYFDTIFEIIIYNFLYIFTTFIRKTPAFNK